MDHHGFPMVYPWFTHKIPEICTTVSSVLKIYEIGKMMGRFNVFYIDPGHCKDGQNKENICKYWLTLDVTQSSCKREAKKTWPQLSETNPTVIGANHQLGCISLMNHGLYSNLVVWFQPTVPFWKIWLSQLGWWHSQYMEKNKKCLKPPTRTNYYILNMLN